MSWTPTIFVPLIFVQAVSRVGVHTCVQGVFAKLPKEEGGPWTHVWTPTLDTEKTSVSPSVSREIDQTRKNQDKLDCAPKR